MTPFLAVLARYWQPVAALGAALGVLLYGRQQRGRGATERETTLRADATAAQLEATTHASNAIRDVRDAAQRERLRAKWTRDD